MGTLLRCLLFLVLAAALGECQDQVALPFTRQILLRGIGNVTLNSTFNELVTQYLNVAIDPRKVFTNSFAHQPDVVIVASQWFTGSPDEVMTDIEALNGIFDGWSTVPDAQLIDNLNQLSLNEFGRQPARFEFTNVCEYQNDVVSVNSLDFGFNNLTLSIAMQENPRERLVMKLCQIFSMQDCSLITLGFIDFVNQLFFAHVTVTTPDRSELLLELVDHLRYASTLLSERIVSVVVEDVSVYSRPSYPALTYHGDVSSCLPHYWFLIFLILLIPVILIGAQRLYYCGEESGKKSIRNTEWDIRGGVRYKERIQTQLGGRMQPLPSVYSGPMHSGNQYSGDGRQYMVWQEDHGTQQGSQQDQSVYYDTNSNWQYTGVNQNQQLYSVVGRN
ncbi:hypothetical protein DQ04_06461020 [Trypanosoma grayi]|uniref:hypothetical protein n=1 Tax=Trypanosoma grayi TaxID=71804 RepID=UPI0004F44364|nr:hypothetical protein DQ04_06461020 [Trypanosoma grayi]KEG08782.1 hypothetical protein DQ04_06461020 [Trypanosoma grayi]